MQIGQRIIFNKVTGKILNGTFDEREDTGLTQEMIGEMRPSEIDFVDLEYGQIDYTKYRIVAIDTATKQPILEELPKPQPSYEELQQQLLQSQGVI